MPLLFSEFAEKSSLSFRASDRRHWRGNPFSFCVRTWGRGLPRQSADWLAMTAVFGKFYPTLKKLLAMSALCLASLA